MGQGFIGFGAGVRCTAAALDPWATLVRLTESSPSSVGVQAAWECSRESGPAPVDPTGPGAADHPNLTTSTQSQLNLPEPERRPLPTPSNLTTSPDHCSYCFLAAASAVGRTATTVAWRAALVWQLWHASASGWRRAQRHGSGDIELPYGGTR